MFGGKSKIWGYLTVIGAFLYHLSLGYNYTVGNMNPYLENYMGITTGQTVWFHAVVISGQAIAMPLGGMLAKKLGYWVVEIIGAVMTSGGVALSNLTVKHGLGPFIFTYSVMFGLGMGLPYSVLFTTAADWFPKHRAAVTGIILGGLGMGALVFTPTQTALINPDGLKPEDPRIRPNVRRTFLVLAGMMIALQVIAFLLVRKAPSQEEEAAEDAFEESEHGVSPKKAGDKFEYSNIDFDDDNTIQVKQNNPLEVYNYTTKEALKSIDFYNIAIMIFINTVPITLQSSIYKKYGVQKDLEDSFLSSIATCTAIFNCTGRVTWGLLCDRLSFKIPTGWFLIQWAFLFGTFPAITMTEGTTLKALYGIWVFLLFFSMAGHFVLMPAACSRIFGPKNSAITYGLLYLTTCPSALILAAILSVHDVNENLNMAFFFCCGLCVISFLLSLFLKDRFGRMAGLTRVCVTMCNACRYEPPEAEMGGDNAFDNYTDN